MTSSESRGGHVLLPLLSRLVTLSFVFTIPATGHDLITTKITWAREVSRILDLHCISCHHQGGASFPLTTYSQVRPWAKAIKEEVLARRMPPWGAVSGFGEFRHDPSLSQEELMLIAAWAEGGAPEGDLSQLPKFGATGQPLPARPRVPPASVSLAASEGWVAPRDLWLLAIQPSGTIANQTKVIAQTPAGAWVPLLWVYGYPSAAAPPFEYERPVYLPRGTRLVIANSPDPAPARFRLWCRTPGANTAKPVKATRPAR